MKQLKRIFCLSLILVMSLSIFAGCKRDQANTKIGDGKITVGIPGTSSIPDLDTNGLTLYLERESGLEIKWVEFAAGSANYKQQITLMCSGNETLPEVMVGFDGMGHYTVNQLGEDGFIQDLKPLIDAGKLPTFSKQLEALPEKTKNYVLTKGSNTSEECLGAFFALPTVACETIDDQQSMIYINKTWLDRLNLEVPKTIADLEKVCKAFLEKDANGNGDKTDEYPMLDVGNNPEVRNWIINAYVEYNGGCFNVDANGTVWDPHASDEFRQALSKVNEWTKKGYYNEQGYTLSQGEVKNLISPVDGSACKVGIFGGHMETSTNAASSVLEEFICLAPLKDETGKGGYNIINDVLVTWDGYITKDCYDLDEACRLLDVFYQDECVTTQRWGTEGEYWVKEDVTNWFGSTSYFKVLNSNAFFDMSLNALIPNVLGIMTHNNYMTYAQTAENSTNKRQIEVSRLIAGQWEIMQSKEYKHQIDTLENLVYTPEEYNYREQNLGMYDSYVGEMVVLFMKGEKNVNSDSEWSAFQKQLDKLNRAKIIETQQNAYNRKVGK